MIRKNKIDTEYTKILDYLFSRLPMYQRIGAAAYKANLDNTYALMKSLSNPQYRFKSIHIAGTNGKGSTSHLLAAIFQTAGYKTGLYTSPHLIDFRERIKINGENISKREVIHFVNNHKSTFDDIQPSFFEWTVALAFDYFSRKKVDVAIIETGLGGRLDSTNIINPELSIITNISFDHMNLLGNTLPQIATEKAGIIKNGIPVLIGEKQNEVASVFKTNAKLNNSFLFYADSMIKIKKAEQVSKKNKLYLSFRVNSNKENFYCDLPGLYQAKNIKTVLAAVSILNTCSHFKIKSQHVKLALKHVQDFTGLMGRWQILNHKPLIIVDTGHNKAGVKEVIKNIKQTQYDKLHFVLGVVNDKDISSMLEQLPKRAIYYFCKASIPRALDEQVLQKQAKEYNLKGSSFVDVRTAIKNAIENSNEKDLIFIGGSTFTVADSLSILTTKFLRKIGVKRFTKVLEID